jgi:hypothetical protein
MISMALGPGSAVRISGLFGGAIVDMRLLLESKIDRW